MSWERENYKYREVHASRGCEPSWSTPRHIDWPSLALLTINQLLFWPLSWAGKIGYALSFPSVVLLRREDLEGSDARRLELWKTSWGQIGEARRPPHAKQPPRVPYSFEDRLERINKAQALYFNIPRQIAFVHVEAVAYSVTFLFLATYTL